MSVKFKLQCFASAKFLAKSDEFDTNYVCSIYRVRPNHKAVRLTLSFDSRDWTHCEVNSWVNRATDIVAKCVHVLSTVRWTVFTVYVNSDRPVLYPWAHCLHWMPINWWLKWAVGALESVSESVSEQFLNGTSAHIRLFSAIHWSSTIHGMVDSHKSWI